MILNRLVIQSASVLPFEIVEVIGSLELLKWYNLLSQCLEALSWKRLSGCILYEKCRHLNGWCPRSEGSYKNKRLNLASNASGVFAHPPVHTPTSVGDSNWRQFQYELNQCQGDVDDNGHTDDCATGLGVP
jgi:hypothetical protein